MTKHVPNQDLPPSPSPTVVVIAVLAVAALIVLVTRQTAGLRELAALVMATLGGLASVRPLTRRRK